MSAPTPIPDAVAWFKVRQWPQHVRDAVTERADAERLLHLCTAPQHREAREHQLARIARADKTLANLPKRLGGTR